MKTISKTGILLTLVVSLFISSCAGGYFVTVHPEEPYYVRPASPYYGAVWIPGEWVWNGGRYVYVNGHWDKPRQGHIYVSGRWEQRPRGYVWVKGYWK